MNRKLFVLIGIAICVFLISCSKEEVECNCDVEIVVVDPNEGAVGYYTITNVPSDCKDGVDVDELDLQENHWFQRTKNCD